MLYIVKPVLQTTCIKQPTALRDHFSDTLFSKLNLIYALNLIPAYKDHLLLETSRIPSNGWCLNTGYIVVNSYGR